MPCPHICRILTFTAAMAETTQFPLQLRPVRLFRIQQSRQHQGHQFTLSINFRGCPFDAGLLLPTSDSLAFLLFFSIFGAYYKTVFSMFQMPLTLARASRDTLKQTHPRPVTSLRARHDRARTAPAVLLHKETTPSSATACQDSLEMTARVRILKTGLVFCSSSQC